MNIVDKSKEIVKYICENFEEWDLDDPIEEGYIDDYEAVIGATEEELKSFEEAFEVSYQSLLKSCTDTRMAVAICARYHAQ